MKKVILAVAALLFAAASANAQLGVIAGVTSSATDVQSAYEDIAVSQNVTQYHAGLVLRLNLPMGLYVQPGVVYNMKGQALKDQIANQEVNITSSTGYAEIPVQLGFKLDLGMIAPYAFVEPYAGYAITTETKTEFQNATAQGLVEAAASATGNSLNTNDENKWNGRERLEYGVGAGVGVNIMGKISVQAKYYWDMGKAFTEDGKAAYSAQHMYEATKDQQCSGISASVILYF